MMFSPRKGKSSLTLRPRIRSSPNIDEHPPFAILTESPSVSTPARSQRASNGAPSAIDIQDKSRRLRRPASISLLLKQTSLQALRRGVAKRQSSNLSKINLGPLHQSTTHLPGTPGTSTCSPPTLVPTITTRSSIESLIPDRSGISEDFGILGTPASNTTVESLDELSYKDSAARDMGPGPSKLSNVVRKPLPRHLRNRRSKQSIIEAGATESALLASKTTPDNKSSESDPAPPCSRSSSATVSVHVPRRRSSLTVLHLDASHFVAQTSKGSRRMRGSSFSDNFQPVLTGSSEETVLPVPQAREVMLSPPILSPTASRSSSAGSRTHSSRTASIPTYIHLPPTFPDGPIEMPVPELSKWHHQCYQNHRHCLRSPNKWHPAPCMTCQTRDAELRWKCTWCALRICADCMQSFVARGRSLEALMKWVEGCKPKGAEGACPDEKGKEIATLEHVNSEHSSTARGGHSQNVRPRGIRLSGQVQD